MAMDVLWAISRLGTHVLAGIFPGGVSNCVTPTSLRWNKFCVVRGNPVSFAVSHDSVPLTLSLRHFRIRKATDVVYVSIRNFLDIPTSLDRAFFDTELPPSRYGTRRILIATQSK